MEAIALTPVQTAAAPWSLRRREFRAMGSEILVVLAAGEGPRSQRDDGADPCEVELRLAADGFAAWEAQLSRFRGDSGLARLNAADGRRTAIGPVLWDVLRAALDAARWTQGLVTPTLLAALEHAGYDRSFDALAAVRADPLPRPDGGGGWTSEGSNAADGPNAADGRTAADGRLTAAATDWRAIRMDPAGRTVTLPAGMRLDLGGSAKGWAADQAARRLAATAPALVDAGGDIAVSGPMPDGNRWPIAVADPRLPDARLAVLWLGRGGVATSGTDVHRWQRDGHWQHHIIDPRTGAPAATDLLSATVVARSAVEAEAAAKAALILGRRAGMAWIERHPYLSGMLVGLDGAVHVSDRLARHLKG